MTIQGLTLEEHRRLGVELASFRDRLVELGVLIANTHRQSDPITKFALKMTTTIDLLRSKLDSEVFRVFPELGMPDAATVYYPNPEDRMVWEKWWADPKVLAAWDGKRWVKSVDPEGVE